MFTSVFVHKMFYYLLKCAFRAIRKHKLVFVNSMPKVESNAIFVVNHSCMHDIPYVCEAIGKQCMVLIAKQPLKFVTMKNPIGLYSRNLFENWLKRHKMSFHDIFYCSESSSPTDKLNGCKRFDVKVMIDDRPNVALFLAENGIKVLLFNVPYNQGVSHKNIVRVADWEDVYLKIGELTK